MVPAVVDQGCTDIKREKECRGQSNTNIRNRERGIDSRQEKQRKKANKSNEVGEKEEVTARSTQGKKKHNRRS